VELPTGSGVQADLSEVADELERRLVSLFVRDPAGRRPADGAGANRHQGGRWAANLLFHEYFNGDTGEGLGASHQAGWTALAGAMVAERHRRAGKQGEGT